MAPDFKQRSGTNESSYALACSGGGPAAIPHLPSFRRPHGLLAALAANPFSRLLAGPFIYPTHPNIALERLGVNH
jgi:hypothetical protein